MSQSYTAIALCALGLEKVLSAELEKAGYALVGKKPGQVMFSADATGLLSANIRLRTAERILLEAGRFPARDFDALFEGARTPAWEDFFFREDRLVIERVRTRNSALTAQTSIQSVVHKAIYERLGARYKLERLPETGRTRSLRVYLEDDICTLGLDLSGEALHRRGYRRATGEAPLKETIAAGALLLAGYRRSIPLVDPFCGSGTILIEAALFALDKAPGLSRHFDLEAMPFARGDAAAAMLAERERIRALVRKDAEPRLLGLDADPRALESAKANAERAGVAPLIEFRQGRAEALEFGAERGILLCNPPYGERLGTEEEALSLYRRMGERLGARGEASGRAFPGWSLGFITNRRDFGDYFGRRALRETLIVNGQEEQCFHWYPAGWEERPARAASPSRQPQSSTPPAIAPRTPGPARPPSSTPPGPRARRSPPGRDQARR